MPIAEASARICASGLPRGSAPDTDESTGALAVQFTDARRRRAVHEPVTAKNLSVAYTTRVATLSATTAASMMRAVSDSSSDEVGTGASALRRVTSWTTRMKRASACKWVTDGG